VPRLSLWKNGKHTNDYKFFDRRISEMFTLGGTGILVHKYLGPIDQGPGDSTVSDDPSKPYYQTQSEKNIEDLLFLENRDRKYDTSVYTMRGIYQTADIDFDLSQFGLFLSNDTIFMTFHLNDMVDTLGRKLMNGDVLELQHLTDYHSLDTSVPVALKRFYVVTDAARSSEGYSPTWWPHLWRVKLGPLVDSQEYSDITKTLTISPDSNTPLAEILSTYDKNLSINAATLAAAEAFTPAAGYDTDHLYTVPVKEDNSLGNPETLINPDSTVNTIIDTPNEVISGYLTESLGAPNGLPVTTGIAFPDSPDVGDYVLRLDYLPNRLFRFDGKRWVKVEDKTRENYTPGSSTHLKGTFVNNTANVALNSTTTVTSRQGLSQAGKNRTKKV